MNLELQVCELSVVSQDVDYTGVEGILRDFDERHGDGELEAAWAGAAGVEVEDSVVGCDRGLVGVAADDAGDSGGVWVDIQPVDGVDEVEETASEFDGFGFGKLGADAVDVDIAADRGDRGDLAEGVEDVGVANVAGVEDVVDTGEGGERFGAQQAVGVGDNA